MWDREGYKDINSKNLPAIIFSVCASHSFSSSHNILERLPGGHEASAGFFCSTSSPPGPGLLLVPPPPKTKNRNMVTNKGYMLHE